MIEILGSKKEGQVIAELLESALTKATQIDGQYYRGFPVLATRDGPITLDGLLCSKEHGVTIFHFLDNKEIAAEFIDSVDEIHLKVFARLSEIPQLSKKRELAVPISSIVYAPNIPKNQYEEFNDSLLLSRDEQELIKNITGLDWEHPDLFDAVLSRLQSLTNLKPKNKRTYVKTEGSKGDVLKKLEKSLATLDVNQTRAVLENIDGVQRIRGLAGSGKTVVLARKIAHIHSQNPHWNIAVTFNSRALKSQLIRLIDQFYEDSNGESPNWDKVKVVHAWGSPNSDGVYYQACRNFNKPYYDFGQAKYLVKNGEDIFQAVCRNLLENIDEEASLYDLILIDEAQDFKPEFLQLCYKLLDKNKRLIYAYDELQNLTDDPMPAPEDIWGVGSNGEPLVHFSSPSQDIILDVCYRNPGPILVSAHALGFGIYRKPMIQMFDYAELWNEIGYETTNGKIRDGESVKLVRTSKSSPALLSGHNSAEELIKVEEFSNRQEEYKWVAEQIIHNIKNEEILPSDIIVIHPNTKVMRNEVGILRELLFASAINSSIAGVTSSPDQFSFDDQVTFTSIYRAKGNEAAMVYIINADYCNIDFELAKKRNMDFPDFTRHLKAS
jgi:superfamily I DNA and RNA helicase